jgi:hypothetical protein
MPRRQTFGVSWSRSAFEGCHLRKAVGVQSSADDFNRQEDAGSAPTPA